MNLQKALSKIQPVYGTTSMIVPIGDFLHLINELRKKFS